MRAVIYSIQVPGKTISQTVDFAFGDKDPGENQARSNLYAAVLANGFKLTDEVAKSFRRIEVPDPHAR